MFYMGSGDIQRIGGNVIKDVLDLCVAVSGRNIVDFIASASMTVGGHCPKKTLIADIQSIKIRTVYRKFNIQICV